jgi:hypothetical protein
MFRLVLTIVLLLVASAAGAADFPTGVLKGISFKVERGTAVVTDRDLHLFEASATITSIGASRYEIVISARMQSRPTTPLKEDRRRDVFTVVWEGDWSGRLINAAPQFAGDESGFSVDGNKLIIRSWVARNQMWETHTYLISSEQK